MTKKDEQDPATVFELHQLDTVPVDNKQLRLQTQRDPVLSRVRDHVMTGKWLDSDDESAKYQIRKDQLSVQQGCLLWGSRVVVPPNLRQKILNELHESHPGVVKMKSVARSYVWWPSIDRDIEHLAKSCSGCINKLKNPPKSKLHPWNYPQSAWERVHIDYAGPFQGNMYLLLQDAYSKWPEVAIMKSTTTSATIKVLKSWFARFGLPLQIFSDNGPQFASQEFQDFCQKHGIKSCKSSPWHPASNGKAEHLVQSMKASLMSQKTEAFDSHQKLYKFLFNYRNSVHSTTNESPAMLLLGRSLRSRLDLLKPDLRKTVEHNQYKTPRVDDKLRNFGLGEQIITRDYRNNDNKWQSGEIIKQTGPLSYHIQTSDGSVWRRHADQILSSSAKQSNDNDISSDPNPCEDQRNDQPTEINMPQERTNVKETPIPAPRRSTRCRNPPDRYGETVMIE